MTDCGLLSTINTYVCQHLLTIYCVHNTTDTKFNYHIKEYLTTTYKSELCNNVYLFLFFISLLK